ncbi:hypothetical protein Mp_1g26070 [Marchantia polymorpha subsp. ruderalis]|uniref:Uncharacterized protein n=2 Tax=Marchantia polymorpha TaxID=3197 RepID=A0AAF6AUE2_MARPO|nr:hypothetical protein MARPO_0002s0269 [Marchantia polymorpha]BBN00063.1 hypothetical protein Mp_1g26070 [Marchantia polymorpha subsp. ruderalis]|eukprot:PTQ49820.1 hypothetical protein MARPO_0002s0269 [Marchantia polymorpha]
MIHFPTPAELQIPFPCARSEIYVTLIDRSHEEGSSPRSLGETSHCVTSSNPTIPTEPSKTSLAVSTSRRGRGSDRALRHVWHVSRQPDASSPHVMLSPFSLVSFHFISCHVTSFSLISFHFVRCFGSRPLFRSG